MIPYDKTACYIYRRAFAEAWENSQTYLTTNIKMNKKIVLIHTYDPPRKIKAGFYWPAAILPTLWALSEGLIPTAGRSFAFDALLGLALSVAPTKYLLLALIVSLALLCARNIYFGKKAQSWLQKHLERKGYKILQPQ